MKVAVVGSARKVVEDHLSEFGLELDRKNPDVVISFGGDGTALIAERIYTGIPRVMIKHSRTCEKCEEHDFAKVLKALKEGNYRIKEEIKVEGIANNDPYKKLIGLNEIGIHHKNPTKTIRLKVDVNRKTVANEVIGDGLVVATPYGSTAYFYSICKERFSEGLGIAFNNSKKKRKPVVVDEDSVVEVEILRGFGLVTADNNEKMIPVKTGDVVEVRKAEEVARIIELEGKRRIEL